MQFTREDFPHIHSSKIFAKILNEPTGIHLTYILRFKDKSTMSRVTIRVWMIKL
jgi:hypothetical protein